MIEKAVEMPVVRRAERSGWFVRKLEWPGRAGAPDRLFIKDARVVFIEFKRPGGQPRLSQIVEHDRMRAAGAEIHVCDNAADAISLLENDRSTVQVLRAALEKIAAGDEDPRRTARIALGSI